MDHSSIELHDAVLIGMRTNYSKRELTLDIEYYPQGNESSRRVPATITFSGVEQLNEIADFSELTSNQSAGNIGYWLPASGLGTTYIYLVNGLITVRAAGISFVQNA